MSDENQKIKFDPGPLDRNTLFGQSRTIGSSQYWRSLSHIANLKTLYRFYSVVSGTTESWGFEESNSLPHYLQSLWFFSVATLPVTRNDSDSPLIWNPDHLDRIWKNGIDMYLTCTYMLRNVKHVHTWYVHVYTMYIQTDRCTYMSVHLCKFLYVSCT